MGFVEEGTLVGDSHWFRMLVEWDGRKQMIIEGLEWWGSGMDRREGVEEGWGVLGRRLLRVWSGGGVG